ncbi:hypothetical protein D3C77_513540 [compost metagenome]
MSHFQRRYRYSASVCRFGWPEINSIVQIHFDSFQRGRHVGAFSYVFHAVGNEQFCRFLINFVLGCARQGNIARNAPNVLTAFDIDSRRMIVYVFFDPLSLYFLDAFHGS